MAKKKITEQTITTNEVSLNDTMSIESMMSKCQATTSGLFHTISLNDSVSNLQDAYNELAGNSTAVTISDHYGNSLSAIGTNDKVQSFTNYGFSNDTLNWTLWLALYNDSWVFRRAIDKPAQDEINCGITIHGDEDYTKVYKALDKYKTDLQELLMWGALFGGSVAVMMFDGMKDEDYANPMTKKNIVGKRMRLYVTDRWYGCSASTKTVSSMRDIDFGKPTSYQITFANGKSFKVHHSYVLRYEHRTAPRLIKSGQLMGWGYAEGSHILNELSRDDQLKSSITSLVNKSLIEVIKMSGMRGVFMGTDKGNMQQLQKRLEMVNWGRTYNSLTFLDKDDEYQQYQLSSIGGLSDLLEKNMWQVAAALEMQGILFGELKGGLSNDSDAKANYANTINNRCNAYVRPVMYKLLKVLFIILKIEGTPDFDFNSLNRNEENKNKVDSIKGLSDMLNTLVSNGIISKYQYAQSIKNYMNNDAIDLIITQEHLNKLKLEEEQAILDTIKEISSKTKRNIPTPTFNNGGFGTVSSEHQSNLNPVSQEQNQVAETSESQNTDIGENINNEETGEQQTEQSQEQRTE